jgi:CRISPR-associated protein Csm3
MKLTQFTEITGTIRLESGLHIGAGDTEMKIGGTDNPVIKHPHTQAPYIPGSSLKGKIRALLEMRSGLMTKTKGSPVSLDTLKDLDDPEKTHCENILKLFGTSGADSKDKEEIMERIGPGRVSFADCPLSEDWREKALTAHFPLTEVKSENAINRIKGTAENPRFTERVPADTEFAFRITMKQLADDDAALADFLLEGMKLLQMDALGGSGSRGYGRVTFQFDDLGIKERFDGLDLFRR